MNECPLPPSMTAAICDESTDTGKERLSGFCDLSASFRSEITGVGVNANFCSARLLTISLSSNSCLWLWISFHMRNLLKENTPSMRVMEKCGFLPTGRETLCPNLYGGAERKVRVMKLEGEERRPHFSSDTIGLFTTDNARMVAFYHEVFGFSTDWNGQEPNVEMRLGTMRLIMFPRTAFEEMTGQKYAYPAGLNGTMELSFDVPTFPDVDKAYAYALKRGATPVFPPTTEPWGQRTCYVADPEGNLIEISSFCHADEELTVDS